jgi:transcriptional regulator with XRE-family HTH domain
MHYPNLGFFSNPCNLWRMSRAKFSKADDVFRQELKQQRISKGLTQAELARRLRQPQSHVSKYELGERRLDLLETVLICEAMGVDFVEFAASIVAKLKTVRRGRSS